MIYVLVYYITSLSIIFHIYEGIHWSKIYIIGDGKIEQDDHDQNNSKNKKSVNFDDEIKQYIKNV